MTQVLPETAIAGPDVADQIAQTVLEHMDRYAPQLGRLGVLNTPFGTAEGTALDALGYDLWVKDDTWQPTQAFKVRGAGVAALAALEAQDQLIGTFAPAEQPHYPRLKRLVAATRGNHGIAVAYVANKLGLGATIESTTDIAPAKHRPLLQAKAEVNLHPTLELARGAARQLSAPPDRLYIDPFNDEATIAGGASAGVEVSEAWAALQVHNRVGENDCTTLLVPAGGVGLGAGVAIAIKRARDRHQLNSNFRVVLVQMDGCDAAARLVYGREPLTDKTLDASCDGTAVVEPGQKTLPIAADRRYVDKIISVPKALLAATMRDIYERTGRMVEPAGALAEAGALFLAEQGGRAPRDGRGHHMVAFRSGANISKEQFATFTQLTSARVARKPAVAARAAATPKPAPGQKAPHQASDRQTQASKPVGPSQQGHAVTKTIPSKSRPYQGVKRAKPATPAAESQPDTNPTSTDKQSQKPQDILPMKRDEDRRRSAVWSSPTGAWRAERMRKG